MAKADDFKKDDKKEKPGDENKSGIIVAGPEAHRRERKGQEPSPSPKTADQVSKKAGSSR